MFPGFVGNESSNLMVLDCLKDKGGFLNYDFKGSLRTVSA